MPTEAHPTSKLAGTPISDDETVAKMGHPDFVVVLDPGHPPVGGPVGFDFDGGRVAGGVVVEAAPAVVFGFGDEATGDGVAVDVADFFFEFSGGEDVEVVVAGLPKWAFGESSGDGDL